jgi:hypothetical protein
MSNSAASANWRHNFTWLWKIVTWEPAPFTRAVESCRANFARNMLPHAGDERPEKGFFLSTRFLVAVILFLPPFLVIAEGGNGETATFAMVMFSGPVLIGLMAQRVKGRTGALWWFLSLVVMFIANLLAGGGASSDILARTIMFGALPMVIIVATLPRRSVYRDQTPQIEATVTNKIVAELVEWLKQPVFNSSPWFSRRRLLFLICLSSLVVLLLLPTNSSRQQVASGEPPAINSSRQQVASDEPPAMVELRQRYGEDWRNTVVANLRQRYGENWEHVWRITGDVAQFGCESQGQFKYYVPFWYKRVDSPNNWRLVENSTIAEVRPLLARNHCIEWKPGELVVLTPQREAKVGDLLFYCVARLNITPPVPCYWTSKWALSAIPEIMDGVNAKLFMDVESEMRRFCTTYPKDYDCNQPASASGPAAPSPPENKNPSVPTPTLHPSRYQQGGPHGYAPDPEFVEQMLRRWEQKQEG